MKSVACVHCGLPVLASRVEEDEAFCCSGCHVAYQLTKHDGEGQGDPFLARVLLSAFLSMGVMVFSLALYGEVLGGPTASDGGEGASAVQGVCRLGALALSTAVLWILGLPLAEAVVALRRWLFLDGLVLVGALAAWGVSLWSTYQGTGEVYFDTATMVLCLYGLGRFLDSRARKTAFERLSLAVGETRVRANIVRNGSESLVDADQLDVGDVVRVRPGELVPADGDILEGASFFDTSTLTGESRPRSHGAGDAVLGGWRAVDGSVLVRVSAPAGERVLDSVKRVLGSAVSAKSDLVRLADRFSRVVVPVVLLLASLAAYLGWRSAGVEEGVLRFLTVVLVSCPCALGIATPLAFWVALGEAWKGGVLVRGGEVLENLAASKRFLFDKTGTLTGRELELPELEVDGDDSESARNEVRRIAAALELGSEHVIGRSLRRGFDVDELPSVSSFRVLPGRGVEGVIDGRDVSLSSSKRPRAARTSVDLIVDGERRATFHLKSDLVPGAAETLRDLEQRGLALGVLTGDTRTAGESLSKQLAVDVESELLPHDKVERVRGDDTVYVGDGLNDVGALAAATVGVSVPESATASLELADVNLLQGGVERLVPLVDLSRKAVRTARMNLFWACAYNLVGLSLAMRGDLSPIVAAAAMVLSSVAVTVHSSLLRWPEDETDAVRTSPHPATHIG